MELPKIFRARIGTPYKNNDDCFLRLAGAILICCLFVNFEKFFLWAIVVIALVGLMLFIYKLRNKSRLELFDILAFVFLIIYAIGVVVLPFFDMLLFVFSCALLVSMFFCMSYCKDEDAKAIALLHVIYIFSCNLVMPCIGTSI